MKSKKVVFTVKISFDRHNEFYDDGSYGGVHAGRKMAWKSYWKWDEENQWIYLMVDKKGTWWEASPEIVEAYLEHRKKLSDEVMQEMMSEQEADTASH